MNIFPLQQALCSDRSQVSYGPEPQKWIAPSLPDGWRLVSFHFFVNWNSFPPVVADQIWMTRQLRPDFDDSLVNVSDVAVLQLFNQSYAKQEFDELVTVCLPCGHKVAVILLPEILVSNISDQTPVWVIARPDGRDDKIHRATVADLKRAIQKHSGGPVRVGRKGLTYGTSAVECYLSNSDAAFPGDADAVIVDNENRVRCVVEYKKHTLQDPIGEHLMTRYFPIPDGRKYQRLAALANRYEYVLQQNVPLVVFYYSTKQPFIRLQEIGYIDEDRVEVSRDTGDISINNRLTTEVSNYVARWLGVS